MKISIRQLRSLINEALTQAQIERRQALLDALEEKREEEERRKQKIDRFEAMIQTAADDAALKHKPSNNFEEPLKRQLLVRTTKSTRKGQQQGS